MKEAYGEQLGLSVIEAFVQDVRYGARTLLRAPGFTIAALLAFTRTLQNFVWGVNTLDPATFATVALIPLGVALLASTVPALALCA